MENATEALMMAFAVFVLIIALSTSIVYFSQARYTADAVLQSADETAYYEYEYEYTGSLIDNKGNRIVGVDTIMPTVYRYKTDYIVVTIKDKHGNEIKVDSDNNADDVEFKDIYDKCAR